jgi:hypothetical protein
MGGVSLKPIPIAVGLGLDLHAGTQKYEFDFGGIGVEDTLEVKRTYIKLPVAYQLSLPMLKGYFGLYPAYALYSVKGKGEPDSTRIDFKGLAFGGFFDYGPSFRGRSKKVFHYGINLGLLLSLGVFE